MKLTSYHLNSCIVVKFNECFDAKLVAGLRKQFEQLSHQNCDIHFDFSKVCFIDSSGIGAIVFLYKRLFGHQQQLSISSLKNQPADLFSMLHLDRTIKCYASLEEFISQVDNKAYFHKAG